MKRTPPAIKMLLGTCLLSLTLCQCAAKAPAHRMKRPPAKTGAAPAPTAVTPHEELVADLIQTGRALVGKPYGYRGNLPWRMDCSGFVSYVFSQYGIDLPHSSSAQARCVIPVRDPMPGDLLFFTGRNRKSGRVGHVAIVIDIVDGDPVMMHSTNSRGIIVERLGKSAYFSSRYLSTGRVPALAKLIDEGSLMVPEPTLSPIAPGRTVRQINVAPMDLLPDLTVAPAQHAD